MNISAFVIIRKSDKNVRLSDWRYLSGSVTERDAIINSLSQHRGAADYDAIVQEINTNTQAPYLS
jgi:hypothetical protein